MPADLLSKSSFIRSLQCQKSLYLHKRHGSLRDKLSQEQQAIFARGHSVGSLAQKLFPGGVNVGWSYPAQYERSVNLTKKHIETGTKIIYEATFLADDVLIALDILVRKNDGWHAYEVKSSLQPSETFLRDAALQHYIITQSGLELKNFWLLHLNREYERNGTLDLKNLFRKADVNEEITTRRQDVIEGLAAAKRTLESESIPDVAIGPQCEEPYPCDFRGHCWKNDRDSDSIFRLTELEEERKWKLYTGGIRKLPQLPEDILLSREQRIQLECLVGKDVHIEPEEIRNYTDYEGLAASLFIGMGRPAVPLFSGTGPYHHVPFAFGLASDKGNLTYVSESTDGINEQWITHFLEATEGIDQLFTYDQASEIRALGFIAKLFPQLRQPFEERLQKIRDLAAVIERKHFYHARLAADTSLETVLAVIGQPAERRKNAIKNRYMCGVAFENLFVDNDLFRSMEIREKIKEFAEGQARSVQTLHLNYREIAREEEQRIT